jgi:AcrR family transcriptional regulator
MKKSERTKEKILKMGMDLVSFKGLVDLSIGDMAKACGLSRSGLIAHFKNKEEMQIEILKFSEDEFKKHVIKKSYTVDPMENLNALSKNWLNWTKTHDVHLKGGCPFIKAAIEFKDRESTPVRDFMEDQQRRLLLYMTDVADRLKEHNYFDKAKSSDQFAYEIYSLYLGHTIIKSLLKEESADDKFQQTLGELIKKYQA